jgi:hypothetical protein
MIDPIVEEARAAGQAYIDSFKGNRKAMLDDLRRRSREGGREVVTLPPRRIDESVGLKSPIAQRARRKAS